MVVLAENLTHAQTVCTRPFLLRGPGDEANDQCKIEKIASQTVIELARIVFCCISAPKK